MDVAWQSMPISKAKDGQCIYLRSDREMKDCLCCLTEELLSKVFELTRFTMSFTETTQHELGPATKLNLFDWLTQLLLKGSPRVFVSTLQKVILFTIDLYNRRRLT